jgi:dipeptidyl aminopeptidase/acylaminoacyl peptidase
MDQRQPWSPEDYWQLRLAQDMALSPDGRTIALAVATSDQKANNETSALWLVDTSSGAIRQFTSGTSRDTVPRWSPDGSMLAFTSTRSGETAQLFVISAEGGEARQLTRMRYSVSEPFWAADGRWIGFTARVKDGEPPQQEDDTREKERQRAKERDADQPRVVTRLQYRWDGRGYLEGRAHLFRAWLADGRVEQLTDGDYDDGAGACSPDGHTLAFTSDRSDERDANMTNDIWLLALDQENATPRRLTQGKFQYGLPVWSPDGRSLACIAEPEIHDHTYYNDQPQVIDVETGEARNLLTGQDISATVGQYSDIPAPSVSPPRWSADSQYVHFLAQRRGGVDILRAPVAGGMVERVMDGAASHVAQFALAADGPAIFTLQSSPTRLWDIWRHPAPGQDETPLTDLNGTLAATRDTSEPERFTLTSFDGEQIDTWLYRPPRQTVGALAPLVMWVHGGPHAAYGESFFLQAQALAGMGYAVVYANPRGSSGYGERFGQACDGDWGGGDYRDLMAAIDACIERGGIDPDRLAIWGTSYGGYMTNWAVTQTTRFRAAVTVNSVTNLWSSFGTGDIDSVWAGGDYGWPWDNPGFYRDRSPVTFAASVRTPVRIISAENDYRCPISQSEEWYTWLKRLNNVAVDFVRLPNASHGAFATPRQRITRMRLVLEWITRHCPAN